MEQEDNGADIRFHFGRRVATEAQNSGGKIQFTFSGDMDWNWLPNALVTLDGYFVRWGKIAKAERKEIMKSDDGTFGVKCL